LAIDGQIPASTRIRLHPPSVEGHDKLESWASRELSEPASKAGEASNSRGQRVFRKTFLPQKVF